MKAFFLLLLLGAGASARSQSLKELLYSGKLKNTPGTIIRKTDDLSTKIDTTTRHQPEAPAVDMAAAKPVTVTAEEVAAQAGKPAKPAAAPPATTAATENASGNTTVETPPATADTTAVAAAEAPVAAPVKTPNRIWKEYTDAMVKGFKDDVLASRKVKKETYFITVDYELGTGGEVTVLNVTTAPENEFLAAAVKERLLSSPPQLAPVPKKVKRKYNFTVTKE